ncbi:cupin domain-containing protein [Streptomyces sp. NPDC048436]|uniref:cupin domain-containing protein n=1 Tax=Streptomyces sp. NPDC048436 TaxID=3365550 RepID=UPI003717D544
MSVLAITEQYTALLLPGNLPVLRTLRVVYSDADRPTEATVGAVGAPAHFHAKATELFFVIGGSLQVLVGDEVTVLNAGDFLAVPPYTPHAFSAAPGSTADVLFVFTPGMARFDYLRLLGSVMRGEADPKKIAESSERFDNHYVDSPAWREALAAS